MRKRNSITTNTRFINETLSISDDVIQMADWIFIAFQKQCNNLDYNKVKKGFYRGKGMSYYIIWGYKIRIAYDVYYFTNQKAFDEEIKNVKFDNRFSYDTMTLHITIVVLFGTVCPGYGEDSLYHEIEHIYQWIKGKENNPNFNGLVSDAYTYAVNVLHQEQNTINAVIAWIIYYCNPHEQDAFAHQYYALYKRFPLEFRDRETEIDRHYNDFKYYINFLEQHIHKPKIIPYFKPYEKFGITYKNILPYAKRGFKRFTKKLNHVRAYVNIFSNSPQNEVDKIPENEF